MSIEVKRFVRSMGKTLQDKGYSVPHSVLLHAAAAAGGDVNWHVVSAASKAIPPAVPAEPKGPGLFETRLKIADTLYEDYDFSPLSVEAANGWESLSAIQFTKVVFVSQFFDRGTTACLFTVRFPNNDSVDPAQSEVSFTWKANGERVFAQKPFRGSKLSHYPSAVEFVTYTPTGAEVVKRGKVTDVLGPMLDWLENAMPNDHFDLSDEALNFNAVEVESGVRSYLNGYDLLNSLLAADGLFSSSEGFRFYLVAEDGKRWAPAQNDSAELNPPPPEVVRKDVRVLRLDNLKPLTALELKSLEDERNIRVIVEVSLEKLVNYSADWLAEYLAKRISGCDCLVGMQWVLARDIPGLEDNCIALEVTADSIEWDTEHTGMGMPLS